MEPGPADIRIDLRFRNNLIVEKMEERGVYTIAELSRRIGKPKQAGLIGNLVNMRISPLGWKSWSKKKHPSDRVMEWRQIVLDIAEFLQCEPEDLFTQALINLKLESNRAHLNVSGAVLSNELERLEGETLPPVWQLAKPRDDLVFLFPPHERG